MDNQQGWREHVFRSADGLQLYARDYGPTHGPLRPVLCLPGLTRNSKDFHDFALRLSAKRRVIAPDYRGRGRSAYADWQTYRADVELADAMALMDGLGTEKAVVIGTSRGGLIAMLMATTHRDRLAGVLLNDIGPVLERDGLLRIAGYLGKPLDVDSWEGAVALMKRTQIGFDSLTEEEWIAFAKRLFREDGGRILLDYDPNLARAFPSAEAIRKGPLPEMWDAFACFAGLPVAVLRAEHSDLLSKHTLQRMAAAVEGVDAVTVRNRGHAPFLDEPESLAAIARLLARAG